MWGRIVLPHKNLTLNEERKKKMGVIKKVRIQDAHQLGKELRHCYGEGDDGQTIDILWAEIDQDYRHLEFLTKSDGYIHHLPEQSVPYVDTDFYVTLNYKKLIAYLTDTESHDFDTIEIVYSEDEQDKDVKITKIKTTETKIGEEHLTRM